MCQRDCAPSVHDVALYLSNRTATHYSGISIRPVGTTQCVDCRCSIVRERLYATVLTIEKSSLKSCHERCHEIICQRCHRLIPCKVQVRPRNTSQPLTSVPIEEGNSVNVADESRRYTLWSLVPEVPEGGLIQGRKTWLHLIEIPSAVSENHCEKH